MSKEQEGFHRASEVGQPLREVRDGQTREKAIRAMKARRVARQRRIEGGEQQELFPELKAGRRTNVGGSPMTVQAEWQEIGGTNHPRWIADVRVSAQDGTLRKLLFTDYTLFVFADTLSSEGGYVWQVEQATHNRTGRDAVAVVANGWEQDAGDAKSEAEKAVGV